MVSLLFSAFHLDPKAPRYAVTLIQNRILEHYRRYLASLTTALQISSTGLARIPIT